jgi:hypothetical protein
VDNKHKLYCAFIDDYIFKWRLYDKPITVRLPDGTTAVKKPNTRAAWYNVPRPMYEFFEVSFAEGLASGLSIEETIEPGKPTYVSVIKLDKQEWPALQDAKRKFVIACRRRVFEETGLCWSLFIYSP